MGLAGSDGDGADSLHFLLSALADANKVSPIASIVPTTHGCAVTLIDDAGLWYILGRSDDTLKVAGKRVGPAEVESAAVSHPAVREAAAIGVPHEVKGKTVTVLLV